MKLALVVNKDFFAPLYYALFKVAGIFLIKVETGLSQSLLWEKTRETTNDAMQWATRM